MKKTKIRSLLRKFNSSNNMKIHYLLKSYKWDLVRQLVSLDVMALHRYFKIFSKLSDPNGPLSNTVPPPEVIKAGISSEN